MHSIEVRRLDGESGVLTPGAIDKLRGLVGEQLVLADHPEYESARRVWNGMIDRRPAIIVRCRGVADVLESIRFAQAHQLLLAVRGGGHNVAGYGTCDGGLVLDLSLLRGVRVDPNARVVRVGGGATWADVDRETQVFGLAVPGGIVSTTGVGGLTLGGGQGWLRRTYGMASDSLVSADVVTADGQLLTASEEENTELFWAVRGGGGNFGVVASFQFRAHPVGPMVAFAGPAYPLETAPSVLARVRSFSADAPDEVNISATLWTIPSVEAFPTDLHGREVIIVGATYIGSTEDGERILQPLREFGQPVLDLSSTMPYLAMQKLFDSFFPAEELHYYWKSIYLRDLTEEAAQTVADHVAARTSPMSMAGLWALGGALDHVDTSSRVAGTGGAGFLLEILANWADPSESDANVQWAREFFDAMRPFGTGKTNLNFPGLGDEQEFVRAGFGEHWDRLVDAKQRFDPGNLFRLNQNIEP